MAWQQHGDAPALPPPACLQTHTYIAYVPLPTCPQTHIDIMLAYMAAYKLEPEQGVH